MESTLVVKIDGRQAEAAAKLLSGALADVEKKGKGVGDSTTKAATGIDRLKGSAISAKSALTALATGLAVQRFMAVATETDRLRGSLQTMTGSAANAKDAFAALTKFAEKTPFSLDQSVNAFIKLKALGLEPTERALTSFGNTSSAMGKDMTQMIEAVADASTGEFERLKEFGIKAKQQGDQVSFTFQGVTTTVKKNADEITEYITKIGETNFAGAMDRQMEGLVGKISNFQDALDGLFRAIADEGASDRLKVIIGYMTDLVTWATKAIPISLAYMQAGFVSAFGAIELVVYDFRMAWQQLTLAMDVLWDNALGGITRKIADWASTLGGVLGAIPLDVAQQASASLNSWAENAKDSAPAARVLTDELNKLEGEWNQGRNQIMQNTASLREHTINSAYAATQNKGTGKSLDELAKSGKNAENQTKALTKAEQAAIKERDKYLKSISDLKQGLQEEFASLHMNEREQARLEAQIKLTTIATQNHQVVADEDRIAVDKLVTANYDLKQSQADAADAIKAKTKALKEDRDEVNPWVDALTNAVERIDTAFANVWLNIGKGFDEFKENMKQGFNQLLAELAHLAITRPITIQIASALGLSGASGAASASAGGTSGIGGITSLINAGKNAYSWLTGAGGTGVGLGASVGNFYGYMGDAFNAVGMNGASNAAMNQSFSYSGMTGMEAMKGIGTNMLAGYAGQQLVAQLWKGRESTGLGATAGGVVGSIWGPWGTAAGAAIGEAIDRALGGSDFSGKRVKLGIQTGDLASGQENYRTYSSGLRVGDITRRVEDAGMSKEDRNTYLKAFGDLDSTLTTLSTAGGIKVDFSGSTLKGPQQNYDGGLTPEGFFGSMAKGELRSSLTEAPKEFVKAWLNEIAGSFEEGIQPLIRQIDGSIEEMLSTFGKIIDIRKIFKETSEVLEQFKAIDIPKAFGDIQAAAVTASMSIYDTWKKQTDDVKAMSSTLNNSADYVNFTNLVTQRYQTEIMLLQQVDGALKTIAATFAATTAKIEFDMLGVIGKDGKIDAAATRTNQLKYLEGQSEALSSDIKGTTDPAKILDLYQRIDKIENQRYGMLTAEEKITEGQSIIDYLALVRADAEKQLGMTIEEAAAEYQKQGDTIAVAIQKALDAVNEKMLAEMAKVFADQKTASEAAANNTKSATDQFGAAVNNFGAAVNNIPNSINVNVTVAADEVNA